MESLVTRLSVPQWFGDTLRIALIIPMNVLTVLLRSTTMLLGVVSSAFRDVLNSIGDGGLRARLPVTASIHAHEEASD